MLNWSGGEGLKHSGDNKIAGQKLFGKRALVTGAGTGIGRSIALELAREGADVMLHHSHEAGGALAAVEEIRSHGGKAAVLPGDLSRMGDIHALAKGTLRFLGGIDILVNNAGISMNEPFATVTVEQFDLLYAVNIRAMYFLTQALLPGLISGGNGTVINMSSIQALAGNSENSVYGGTKGAVISFSRHLAIELAPKGVRVNAIAPGAIEVESYYLAMPDFDPQSFGRKIPAGMVGQPWDVARAVVFLASEDARYIIGHTLIVDGGTSAWHAFSEDFRKPSTAVWGKGYVKGR